MKLRAIMVLALTTLLTACASSPTVTVDSDPAVNFAKYRTYTWLARPQVSNPLFQQRIMSGVDARLQAAGWRPSNAGEVTVVAHVATAQKQSISTFYDSGPYAGWGWRAMPAPGMGSATTVVDTYQTGTLVVDLFDTANKKAIWRGTAEADIPDKPEQTTSLLDASLDKMFAGFPPGSVAKTK